MGADRLVVLKNSLTWINSLIANCQLHGDDNGVSVCIGLEIDQASLNR
jgi:hypothetical protein